MRWILLLACFTGLMFSDALAESPDSDDAAFRYDESRKAYVMESSVTVTSDEPEDPAALFELPAFIQVIHIDERAPVFHTLPEVLGEASGVTVRDFGGLGKLSTVSIRGSSSSQVLVLLDGVRINNSSGSGVDLSDLPLDNIEKIEVLRGADSAVFGDGAVGGVINLVTRKRTNASGSGSIEYSSWSTVKTAVNMFREGSGIRFRLHGFYQGSDGDFPFENDNGTAFNPDDDFRDVRRNNFLRSGGLNAWWALPGSPWNLSGSVDGYVSRKGVPGMISFPSEHACQKDRRYFTVLKFHRDWPCFSGVCLSGEASFRRTELDFDDPLGEQVGVPIHTRQRTNLAASRLGWRVAHGRGVGELSVHFSRETLDDPEFCSPQRTTWALSGKHDLELFHDNLWITLIGRYDHVSRVDSRFSPKLGVQWFVSPSFSLKTNVGCGFRAPSFNELYMNAGYLTGNPDLEPEKSVSCDVGGVFQRHGVQLELSLYQMNTRRLIQYVLVSGFRYKPYNIGKVRARGVEFNARVDLPGRVSMTTSYTLTHAVDRTGERNHENKQIPGRPRHTAFARVDWRPGNFHLFSEWRYVSGNYVTPGNTRRLSPRRTVNIGMDYAWNEYIQLAVEVKNLTDDDIVDVRGFPLPPRTYVIGLKFRR